MHKRTKLCALRLHLRSLLRWRFAGPPSGGPAGAHASADHGRDLCRLSGQGLGHHDQRTQRRRRSRQALDTFGAPNVDQLSSAWVSYSGILAAQNPDFVKEVRNIDNYYGRERLMLGLERDLGYARTLKGGEQALQNVLAANTRDTSRLSSAGAFVKEQSYKLQKFGWAKERVNPRKRNALDSIAPPRKPRSRSPTPSRNSSPVPTSTRCSLPSPPRRTPPTRSGTSSR